MIRIILFLLLIASAPQCSLRASRPAIVLSGYDAPQDPLPVFVLGLAIVVAAPRMLGRPARVAARRSAAAPSAVTPGAIRRACCGRSRRFLRARGHAEVAHHAARSAGAAAARAIRAARRRASAQRFPPWPSAPIRACWFARPVHRAQRADDPVGAVMIAEEALKLAPASIWASHALLGFRCAKGDWSGALAILDNNLASGLIDKATYRRQRGVLLTARALELEKVDRDKSRESAMEAIKLAPTLVPARCWRQIRAGAPGAALDADRGTAAAQPHPDRRCYAQ
jgi:HemY protein